MKIVLCGGGTLGHVIPALAVGEELRKKGCDVFFIGSKDEKERSFVEAKGISFYSVSSGKLRRYFSLKNFSDFFRIFWGYHRALGILSDEKPQVLFSKGGFVSVPIALAAATLGIPIITHESDASLGLANKIICKFAKVLCVGQESAYVKLKKGKTVVTGNPIRSDLFSGDKDRMLKLLDLNGKRDLTFVLILGGSQGALKINEVIAANLQRLLKKCNVILQTGRGKRIDVADRIEVTGAIEVTNRNDGTKSKETSSTLGCFYQFEVFEDEYADALALADVVVSRSGAGAVEELRALGKPTILVPLGLDASRGDQIKNAQVEEQNQRMLVCSEYDKLIEKIEYLIDNKDERERLSNNCLAFKCGLASQKISDLIMELGK